MTRIIPGSTTDNVHKAFDLAFTLTRKGSISRELTAKEVETQYPEIPWYAIEAFQNGVQDALENDWFRYNLGQYIERGIDPYTLGLTNADLCNEPQTTLAV